MQIKAIDGTIHEIDMAEALRIHHEMNKHTAATGSKQHDGAAKHYAEKTHEVTIDAQKELREATGDYPEDLEELYEFAAKHELFGDREDTHIMCNFMKVFFGLMQKETHGM